MYLFCLNGIIINNVEFIHGAVLLPHQYSNLIIEKKVNPLTLMGVNKINLLIQFTKYD